MGERQRWVLQTPGTTGPSQVWPSHQSKPAPGLLVLEQPGPSWTVGTPTDAIGSRSTVSTVRATPSSSTAARSCGTTSLTTPSRPPSASTAASGDRSPVGAASTGATSTVPTWRSPRGWPVRPDEDAGRGDTAPDLRRAGAGGTRHRDEPARRRAPRPVANPHRALAQHRVRLRHGARVAATRSVTVAVLAARELRPI